MGWGVRLYQEIDGCMAKKIIHGLGNKEQKIYRHVASGGAWADNHLADIGKSNGRCPHCGEEVQDITHVLWECEKVHKHRQRRELCGIDHKQLPQHIKHGVPSAMTNDIQAPYWSKHEDGNQVSNNKQFCKQIGMWTDRNNANIISCKHQEVKDLCEEHGIDHTQQNARQAFANIKANKQPPHYAVPHRCRLPAPKSINVYSDGSWLYPTQKILGLGGAGVWWPGRDINHAHRLSPAEKELGHYTQLDEGLRLYSPIGGFGGSSTRTELAAAILAIAANGPIHLGTDSQAFLDRATRVIQDVRNNRKRPSHKGNQSFHKDYQMTQQGQDPQDKEQ